jgi:hypothetical protein
MMLARDTEPPRLAPLLDEHEMPQDGLKAGHKSRYRDCGQKARGLNPDDAELAVTIRKRVGACMWKLKQAGYAREVPIAGELKGWVPSE